MNITRTILRFLVCFHHFLDQIWASQVRCSRSRVFHIANHLFWLSAKFQSCVLGSHLGHHLLHVLIESIVDFRHNSLVSPHLFLFQVNVFVIWILHQIHQKLLSVPNMLQRTPLPEIFFRLQMTARRKLRLLPAVLVRHAVGTDIFPALLSTGEVVAKGVRFNSTLACFHQLSMWIQIHNRKDRGVWFRNRVSSLQLIFYA